MIFCGSLAVVIAIPFHSKWNLLAPVFGPLSFLKPCLQRNSRPGVDLIRDQWPDRTESIESFAAGKLNVLLLQIARGHVVHAYIPENVGTYIFIRAHVAACLADHHPQFALEIDSLRNPRQTDFGV